jgi:hypothetical protein
VFLERILTCEPLPHQQSNLVVPRDQVDHQRAHDARHEPARAHIRARVLQVRREADPKPDGDDLDRAICTSEQGRLEGREPEGGDDDLALVEQARRDVEDRCEEGKEPGLGVVYGFQEPNFF